MKKHLMTEVKLSSISPQGWLKEALRRSEMGMAGHLHETGYPFNTRFWGRSYDSGDKGNEVDKSSWWPYEQTAYLIDGQLRTGILNGNSALIGRAKKQILAVINNPDRDGYLGPDFLKADKELNRWSHSVFFRAAAALYDLTGDKGIIAALKGHFLSGTSRHEFARDVCNIETMLWLYEKTGDRRFARLSEQAWKGFNRRYPDYASADKNLNRDIPIASHGVTFNETAKLPALLYLYTGKKAYLKSSVSGYRKVEKYHMLSDGVHSSAESFRGKDPMDSHETCDIVDYQWSLGYLLMATGNARYADIIEKGTFNAGFGAVLKDFKATQYFSCVNQVVATSNSNHNPWRTGNQRMAFRPIHVPECCSGNSTRILPAYSGRMWMGLKNGIAAVCYGPSSVGFLAVNGARIKVVEETGYPFSEVIRFKFFMKASCRFEFRFRVPGWCKEASLFINGKRRAGKLAAGTFVPLRRTFKDGDLLELRLPMTVLAKRHAGGGVSLERGPVLFALPVKEKRSVEKLPGLSTKKFPALNLLPVSKWNFALDLKSSGGNIILEHSDAGGFPFDPDSAAIKLKVPAREVRGWKVIESGTCVRQEPGKPELQRLSKGKFRLTPPLPPQKGLKKRLGGLKEITLIPYGCTLLRLTVLPEVK